MTPSDPRVSLVRPWFLKWSIVVFLLLTPFVAHSIWHYVETRRLRTRIEAIAQHGEPTTALAYRRLTGPSTRAARYYQAAASLVSGYTAAIPAPIGYQLGVAARDGVWPQELVVRARSLIEEHGEALSFADRAAALPFEGFDAGTTFNYLTGNLLGVSRLCALRANINALDGNADAAIASVFTDVKLARATRQAPSFSALAFVLKRTHPSSGALTQLADALAEGDRDDRFKQQLARLRARMLDESFAFKRASAASWPWKLHWFNHSLDVFSQLIAAAGTPPAERHAAVMAVGEWPIWWSRTVSGRTTLESMLRASERETEAIRCARRLVAGEVVDCHF